MKITEQLNYAVIPDTHGEYERTARTVTDLESTVDKFIFLGDVLDGPDTRRLVGLIRGMGDRALTSVGNHEWVCRNALTVNDDEESITDWWARDWIWPAYEEGMMESYGLKRSRSSRLNAVHLREAMAEIGDLEWLTDLPPYIETPDFVAVHAGPELNSPWSEQARYLDGASLEPARRSEEPEQIFSHKLAAIRDIPQSVDERIFVSGHTSFKLPKEQRRAAHRICLASKLSANAPLFVWHSAEDTIYEY